MKHNVKLLICALLLTPMMLSAVGCNGGSVVEDTSTATVASTGADTVTEPITEAPTFTVDAAREVYEQISAIETVSLDTEEAVTAAWLSYCALDDAAKAEVVNAPRLLEMRDLVADLYARTDRRGSKIDRSKILIGSYNLAISDEQHVREVAECGLDFMTGVHVLDKLDLLAQYNIGAFTHIIYHNFPYWRGSDRNPGSDPVTPDYTAEQFEAALTKDICHEAIWGTWIVDEPNAQDYWYYEQIREKFDTFYEDEDYVGYINLFPNYAGSSQLGTKTYEDYINMYVEQIDTDYICYDHYMYTNSTGRGDLMNQLLNLRIAANACRENDRDLWLWQHVNSTNPEVFLSVDQLRMQANISMAFGAQSIIWGCWFPGWWSNNVYDADGNKTEQYDKLKTVNAEINALSPEIIKYNNLDVNVVGSLNRLRKWNVSDDNIIDQSIMTDISAPGEKVNVLCGWFEKRIGNGNAMMFVNMTDSDCIEKPTANVTFRVADGYCATVHTSDGSYVLSPDADGVYHLDIENAEYAFVALQSIN